VSRGLVFAVVQYAGWMFGLVVVLREERGVCSRVGSGSGGGSLLRRARSCLRSAKNFWKLSSQRNVNRGRQADNVDYSRVECCRSETLAVGGKGAFCAYGEQAEMAARAQLPAASVHSTPSLCKQQRF
jgi:hypothetical protein